jgi:hypothetical protein
MLRAQMIATGSVRFSVPFNAAFWFNQATETDLRRLAAEGWAWNRRDSTAAVLAAAMYDDRLAAVLAAVAKSGQDIPFTCRVDAADAEAWLRRYRPRLLQDEEAPDDVRLPLKRYLSRW